MRYKGVSKTAKQVMQDIHGTGVSTSTVMGNANVVPYMQDYGFYTIKSSNWPSVNNTYMDIVYEVNKGRPVILNMVNNASSPSAHALVALGFEDVKGTTTVWNPWYNFFETVISLGNYAPALHLGTTPFRCIGIICSAKQSE